MAHAPDQQSSSGDAEHVSLSLLGELLIAARKERGLSQAALAERLGTYQEAVARWERERYRGAALERLVKVAEALGVTVDVRLLAPPTNG